MSDEERTTNPYKTVVSEPSPVSSVKGSRDACLVVIYGQDLGRRIPLGTRPITIGRSSAADVQIDQESVSRSHCRILFNGKHFSIRDLGSTNGTYVNDDVAQEMSLRDGDQIKVGRTILKFITGGNIEGQYHEEIYRLMTVDGLTQVHNKRYFDEMLEREISRAQRYSRNFALIVFDVDHFKEVNDSYGHLAGDAVLRQLGTMIAARVRRDDIVARTGGEEFAILTPEVDSSGALDLARKLRHQVEQTPFHFESTAISVTISVGLAQWHDGIESVDELIRMADERLYQAKRQGRNRVCH